MTELRSIQSICSGLEAVGDLVVRPWDIDDAPTLVAAWQDEEIARWNPVPPEPSLDLAERWIRSTETQNEASVGIDIVAVRAGLVLGELGLQVDPAQRVAEIGFWVGSNHRGGGVGRGLLAIAQLLGAELELRGLVALVDPGNGAAAALLISMGWPEVPTTSGRRAFAFRVAT